MFQRPIEHTEDICPNVNAYRYAISCKVIRCVEVLVVNAFYFKKSQLTWDCCEQEDLLTRSQICFRTCNQTPSDEVDESNYIEQDNTSPIKKQSR